MQADDRIVFIILFAVLGLLFGSFLNVCIYRIPRDLSVVTPRSFCPECGAQIGWFDNIPILSFALLRGKCRACGKPIGFHYPAVELLTTILFGATAALYGFTLATGKWALFEGIMVVLFFTDLEERILPDELTIGGSIAGIIFGFFVPVPGSIGMLVLPQLGVVGQSLLNAAAGACFLTIPMTAIGFLYMKVRHREGLGWGDVKLLILLGIFLGFEKGLLAMLIGTVAGSVLGLLYIGVTRKRAATYELPLGSFLCAGSALVPLINRM